MGTRECNATFVLHMRFHVLGLPHTVTSKEFLPCAYTQKVVKFAKMMTDRGHVVIHYGHEESNLQCTEHVTVLTAAAWKETYGDHDWRKHCFKFDMADAAYRTFYANAIVEVGKRKQPHDFILPFWGSGVRPVCDAHPDVICVEPGIGYAGGHWARFKIFESYAIYHAYCGLTGVGTCKQDWYEAVIPNYFDADDFQFRDRHEKEDYFLFLGRVTDAKGVHIAMQVTEAIGARLIVAGQNSLKDVGHSVVPPHVTEIGFADVDRRKELMSKAKAAFVCSMYVEPFGGVQVECLFSGTPTITTDWGSFTENNIHGVTGYRCRTMEQLTWAARNIDNIDPKACRAFAVQNFCLDKVALMYEEYFTSVLNIHMGKGWYETNPGRLDLDWLRKVTPQPTVRAGAALDAVAAEQAPFAARVASWCKLFMAPTSALNIGVNPGSVYAGALEDAGVPVWNVSLTGFLQAGLPAIGANTLVLCLEVANEMDPMHNPALIAKLKACADAGATLLWTASPPNRGGSSQINSRPRAAWLSSFQSAGCVHDASTQEILERYCLSGARMGWFLNNLLILKGQGVASDVASDVASGVASDVDAGPPVDLSSVSW